MSPHVDSDFERCRTIAVDHPSLAGHFPGAPVVPGVLLLGEVAAVLAEWRRGCRITGIPAVKFLLPLQPGQPFAISLSATKSSQAQVRFSCRIAGRVIAEGRLEIACL